MKDQEPIDVTTINLERPRPEPLFFDPLRDITEEDWAEIISQFQEAKHLLPNPDANRLLTIGYMSAAVTTLSPERIPLLRTDEIPIRMIKSQLESTRRNGSPDIEALIKIGVGKTPSQLDFSNNTWRERIDYLSNARAPRKWSAFCWEAFNLKLLFPSRISELGLDEEAWENSSQVAEDYKNRELAWSLTDFSAVLKVLFPQKSTQLGHNQGFWEPVKEELKTKRQQGNLGGGFCQIALSLSILTAQEVKVTQRGIDLTFDRLPLTQPTPPMPKTRKF